MSRVPETMLTREIRDGAFKNSNANAIESVHCSFVLVFPSDETKSAEANPWSPSN